MFTLRHRVAFLLGSILILAPVSALAEGEHEHNDITITKNSQFDRAHGVRSGKGTMRDPFVISGWNVEEVTIRNTSKAVVIKDNTITRTLTLNWIGDVMVHRNTIGDLRVNENIERTGEPTAGMIERNTFDSVGQLRHFDGSFSNNKVGSPGRGFSGAKYSDFEAVNFDGFNGARFEHNTIYGYVTARLHGHHHSSGFSSGSHMHAKKAGHHDADHTRRYHAVTIAHNKIYSGNYYALSYTDTNHAGNDRTAPSETNEALNDPHVHYTRVKIMDNETFGSGIRVATFNATDELHKKFARGSMTIEGNHVDLSDASPLAFGSLTGIAVDDARGLSLRIKDNTIDWVSPVDNNLYREWVARGTGISLWSFDTASIRLEGNTVRNLWTGIQASDLTKDVSWWITGLKTQGVNTPVSYDSSVANKPKRD